MGNKMYLLRIQSKEVGYKLEYEIQGEFSLSEKRSRARQLTANVQIRSKVQQICE